ncbi:hypothetical protein AN639_04930 [Candidatus Epulonipiscium fishelsonii]|uniref:Uncharacterized protein n=1 Tax=Candidatus Epulonipiscium fishelsonii TaxID=77094 RepID=A0ACC8XDJ4_9FIRM|nr:hypothetical protein AN639_04930 [Epulopiscium sp. SCG-B05WGA-EpuloA1]ONI40824.1 hypothetical protein AN396_05235 [Epulopiscium sp. SCG-B11WGA-EpuloA1]
MKIYKKILLLLCSISLVGCQQEEIVPTTTASLVVQTIHPSDKEISLSEDFMGSMSPKETTYVFSPMMGIVDKINVEEGDTVTKGEVLFTLEDDTQSFSRDQAEASYNQLQASKDQALLKANLDIENAQASYNQLLLARDQAIIQAQNNINNANQAHNQAVLAKNQALIQAQNTLDNAKKVYDQLLVAQDQATTQVKNTVDNAYKSYDQLLVAQEQALIQAENAASNANAGYNQLIVARDQSVGAGVDMQLLELENQIQTLKNNISNAKLQLRQAEDDLGKVADDVEEAKVDFDDAQNILEDEDELLDEALEAYEEAQIKLSTAKTLAEQYGLLQSSVPALAGVDINEAINFTVEDGFPQSVINSIEDIFYAMYYADIKGLSTYDLFTLSEEATDAQADFAEAQENYSEAKTEEVQNEAIFEQLEDGFENAEIQVDNAEELTGESIEGLEEQLKILEEIYMISSTQSINDAVSAYDEQISQALLGVEQAQIAIENTNIAYKEQIEQALLGIKQAEEAVNLTNNGYAEQISQALLGINQAQEAINLTNDSYNEQINKAQLAIDQATQGLTMTKDSYNEQIKQVQISLSAAYNSKPLIEEAYTEQLNSANIGIKNVDYLLNELIVTSPVNGIVDEVNIEENNPISSSNTACVISDYTSMEATFYVSQEIKDTLSIDQEIVVTYDGQKYNGHIIEIDPNMNQQTSLFKIVATVDVSHGTIPNGVSAIINTTTHKISEVLTIPYTAVYFEDGKQFVYVDRNGIAEKQYVKTGLFDDSTIVITEGLTPSDEVITTWSSQLRDGTPVKKGGA